MVRFFSGRKYTFKPLMWAGCGVLCAATVAAWAYDDVANEVGLNGIVAPFAPNDLGEDAMGELVASLDDSWKPWGEETTQLITEFYEGDHPTIESQQQVLAALKVKLKTMQSSLEDSRYRSVHEEVRELHGRLAPRVEIAEAMLASLTADPVQARQQRLTGALSRLRQANSQLSNDLSSFRNGSLWVEWTKLNDLKRIAGGQDLSVEDAQLVADIAGKLESRGSYGQAMKEFVSRESFLSLEDALQGVMRGLADNGPTELRDQLKVLAETLDKYDEAPDALLARQIRDSFHTIAEIAPDGGRRLQAALRAYYLNFNVRILVSEGLVQRVVSENRQDAAWVNECIMNAHVTGWSCTNATVSADVQPSSSGARVQLNLNGSVQANTAGSVPQATVYSVGYHTFHANKSIVFDGHNFGTDPTRVSASANNQAVDARTRLSGIPLLGPFARGIALKQADGQMGEINAYTIQRLRSEVATQLDSQVGQQFANASMELENKIYGPLREHGLYPDVLQISSTDTLIQTQARVLGGSELAGSRPAPGVSVPASGLVMQVHESAMSNGAERLNLAGKTMTETEIKNLLQDHLKDILGREVELPTPAATEGEAKNETFVFDGDEAIRFVVENGEVKVVIRAGLRRENGDVPPQKITLPLAFRLEGDQIVMSRGQVRVEPLPGQAPANVAEQVTRSRIMIGKIEAAIPEKSFKNDIEVKQQSKILHLKIREIIAQNGWVTVIAE